MKEKTEIVNSLHLFVDALAFSTFCNVHERRPLRAGDPSSDNWDANCVSDCNGLMFSSPSCPNTLSILVSFALLANLTGTVCYTSDGIVCPWGCSLTPWTEKGHQSSSSKWYPGSVGKSFLSTSFERSGKGAYDSKTSCLEVELKSFETVLLETLNYWCFTGVTTIFSSLSKMSDCIWCHKKTTFGTSVECLAPSLGLASCPGWVICSPISESGNGAFPSTHVRLGHLHGMEFALQAACV